MTRTQYIAQLRAAVKARRITPRAAASLLARADAAHRPKPKPRPTTLPRVSAAAGPQRNPIVAVASNPLVRGGLDAIGTAFGDPALGEEVAQAVGVVVGVVDALPGVGAVLDSILGGGATYTPQERAANSAAFAAGYVAPRLVVPPGQRTFAD